jgi:hypothetical protein
MSQDVANRLQINSESGCLQHQRMTCDWQLIEQPKVSNTTMEGKKMKYSDF